VANDSPNGRVKAVIVGSGFGGSVMAYKLAKAGWDVCVLERGRRYPPGSFARSPREMRTNFWDPSKGRYGLFQVWDFGGIDALVSSGLGGGSLIYANVLIRKDEKWFVRRLADGSVVPWPVSRAQLNDHYDEVHKMLRPTPYPLDQAPYNTTRKTLEFRGAAERAGYDWCLPDLAVTFGSPDPRRPTPGEPIWNDAGDSTTDNLYNRTRYTCRLCGECDIGCNFGSKNTLDYNYLFEAEKCGAQLWDLHEVKTLAAVDEGGQLKYKVDYIDRKSDDGRRRSGTLTADYLILSAGTFGSTYLLLKNSHNFPRMDASKLGHNFSGNGDFLGFVLNAKQSDRGRPAPRILEPSRGPVITSTLRRPDSNDEPGGPGGPGLYLQEGGYPTMLDWVVEIAHVEATVKRALHFTAERVESLVQRHPQPDLDREIENLIGDGHLSASVLPMLGMGMDTPGGEMRLTPDGRLDLTWTEKDSQEYFDRVRETMGNIAKELDGKFQEDPLWYLRHKLITVHGLGGCSMGSSSTEGVVDVNGEVFNYPGLLVADGSVMPGPVGPNPSFTIAALANMFADSLVSRHHLKTTSTSPTPPPMDT
jgi:cholesterol oxidase